MNRDAEATHLSRGLQVVADEIVFGGGCAIEQRPGEPAHAQEQVGEAQVEKRANLGKVRKVKLVSRSRQCSQQPHDHRQQQLVPLAFVSASMPSPCPNHPLCQILHDDAALVSVPRYKSSIKPYKPVDDGVICSLAE